MLRKILVISLIMPSICFASGWECIGQVVFCHTWRMSVPSGWIVSGDNSASTEHGYAMTYVPDPLHEWNL